MSTQGTPGTTNTVQDGLRGATAEAIILSTESNRCFFKKVACMDQSRRVWVSELHAQTGSSNQLQPHCLNRESLLKLRAEK
jgi:hypothetical protein